MSFKTKNRKKVQTDTRVTLDAKYKDKEEYFRVLEESIPKKKKIINKFKKQYFVLDKKYPNLSTEEFEKRMSLKDQIKNLKQEIKQIKNKDENIKYLLDTGHLLFQYYNNINDIAEGKIKKYKHKNKVTSNEKTVMEYFQKKEASLEISQHVISEIDKDYKNKFDQKNLSRAKIYDKYLAKTEENFINNSDSDDNIDICEKCNVERTLYLSEGIMVCKNCGEQTFVIIDSDKPSYKDPPREICYFAYKRINHFNEWLAQFQAKESTDIPQEVYDQILVELKKERIENMADLQPQKLREILKKLKKNKYYEHVPHIINRLNGIPPPIMSRETEEELRRMFKEIQIPFHKFCPKARKNFLSYSYVLHKFVQLLELDEFLPCFMLLKSREKLHQQDIIWKQICEYLNWEFIKSL